MNDAQHDHDMNSGLGGSTASKTHRPYWKHAHREWRFWAALVLMTAAMSIYVMSENFASLFGNRPQTSPSSPGGNERDPCGFQDPTILFMMRRKDRNLDLFAG